MGGIDLDPATHEDAQAEIHASAYYTAETDGLNHSWKGRVWLNPPYSQPLIQMFCEKLVTEYAELRVKQAITLTNNGTETQWGQLLMTGKAVCLPEGRIPFWAPRR